MWASILSSGIQFGRRSIGCVVRPYQTYREIRHGVTMWEIGYVVVLILVYFGLVSMGKTNAFNPLILSKQFIKLAVGASVTSVSVVTILYFLGAQIGKPVRVDRLATMWGYTLLPTLAWFVMTAAMTWIFPPPRSETVLGISLSMVYLVATLVFFFWKGELYFLTLRFGLGFDLKRIIGVSIGLLPLYMVLSVLLYRLGIFGVPFL